MMRSLALLLRLLAASSVSPASMGFLFTSFPLGRLPHTHTGKSGGQVQPLQSAAQRKARQQAGAQQPHLPDGKRF